MSEVVIVRKRDAKTDPPEEGTWAMTDAGPLCRGAKCWFRGYNDPVPDPLWWYDLRPTEGEPLTTEDLALVARVVKRYGKDVWNAEREAADRLRATLDALTKEDDSE